MVMVMVTLVLLDKQEQYEPIMCSLSRQDLASITSQQLPCLKRRCSAARSSLHYVTWNLLVGIVTHTCFEMTKYISNESFKFSGTIYVKLHVGPPLNLTSVCIVNFCILNISKLGFKFFHFTNNRIASVHLYDRSRSAQIMQQQHSSTSAKFGLNVFWQKQQQQH